MKNLNLFIMLFVLLVYAHPAFANGGPVGETMITPMGGLALKNDTGISLEYESLNITLHDDMNTYSVEATYHLQNDGPDKVVQFGVPLTWYKHMVEEHLQKNIKLVSGKVTLELDGTRVSCSVPAEGQAADAGLKSGPTEWFFGSYKFENWCLADLDVPGGSRPVLTMRYEGELFYVDWEFSKSALTMFGMRRLYYLFYPAGFWKGTVGAVDVTLDLGPYRNHLESAAPEYTGRTDTTLEWHLKDVDFTKLTSLTVDLSPEALEKRQLMRWNRDALPYRKGKLEATSSSSLPDSGGLNYSPSNIADGDERTAWCEGAEGTGAGEWLELRLMDMKEKEARPYCRIEGIAIVPGYAKSQQSYLQNGRVTKVRIGHCGSGPSHAVDVPLEEHVNLSPYLIRNRWNEAGEKYVEEYKKTHEGDEPMEKVDEIFDFMLKEHCFRMEILDVDKGASEDACISEVAVVFNCL